MAVIVYVTSFPPVTGSGLSVLVTLRSVSGSAPAAYFIHADVDDAVLWPRIALPVNIWYTGRVVVTLIYRLRILALRWIRILLSEQRQQGIAAQVVAVAEIADGDDFEVAARSRKIRQVGDVVIEEADCCGNVRERIIIDVNVPPRVGLCVVVNNIVIETGYAYGTANQQQTTGATTGGLSCRRSCCW